MEIVPLPKPSETTNKEDGVVKEPERTQIVAWLEQLTLPELCQEERVEIVEQLKCALSLHLTCQHAPPVAAVAMA